MNMAERQITLQRQRKQRQAAAESAVGPEPAHRQNAISAAKQHALSDMARQASPFSA
jgi:hypothetical protein